ncbi:MAG: MBL fold metallo-hydrolase [Actinomycetota bacterium]|nr:MBL fold metallo-hydrolase [Actinomycetota bacterium]
MMRKAHITVLGARGSIPVSGSRFARYGGSTTCFALVVGGVTVAFIDAGTGLINADALGLKLAPSVEVFLTHYHWDHIQGLSMMRELWSGACAVCVWGPDDPAEILERAISPPLFPVSIADVASIRFASSDGPVDIGGLTITPFAVHHPQGACGYRVDGPSRSVAIVTDHETGTNLDSGILDAVRGADVLLHDAQYLPDELAAHRGWGHSTHEGATSAARAAGATELILTSHDVGRTDTAIDEMVESARRAFPNTEAARPGMEIAL